MNELKKILTRILFPLSWRKVDNDAFRELAENGNRLTSDKILSLEFNKAALNDMGITPETMPHHKVNVRGIHQDPESGIISKLLMSMMALGYTHAGKPEDYKKTKLGPEEADADYRSVYLNRLLFSPPGQYLAAGLAKSVAVSFASWAVHGIGAAVSWVTSRPLMLAALLTPIRKVVPLHILTMPIRSMAKIMGHEHIHFLQKVDRDTHTSGFDVFKNSFQKANSPKDVLKSQWAGVNNLLSFGMTNYFTTDYEVQARLHTVIANGSHRWERLPKTKEELWLALDDCGLHMPGEIRDELKSGLKDAFNGASGFTAQTLESRLGRAARAAFSPDVAELRAAQASFLNHDGKVNFWRQELPYLYGHLLEMYGQKDGRKMMGFDPAAWPANISDDPAPGP